jgi:hypothetical protein
LHRIASIDFHNGPVPPVRLHLGRPGRGGIGRRGLGVAFAEVGGDDPRIAAHLLGCAVGDHAPELEHDHAVADAQPEPHVVIDQQRGLAAVGQRAQALPEPGPCWVRRPLTAAIASTALPVGAGLTSVFGRGSDR